MNKSVLLLTIAFIAFSCNQEQSSQKSDLASANLKGKVWKVSKTLNETGESCGCVIKTDCNQSEFVYNEKGNLEVFYTVDENKVTNDSTVYKYNNRGICKGIDRYSLKKLIGKEVQIVKNGRLTGYEIFDEKDVKVTTLNFVYTGDEITEEKTVDGNDKVTSQILKEYLNGQLVSQTEKDGDGKVKSISRYKRNTSNDVVECITTITKDNKDFKLTYEYEYDDAGNWVKQTQFYDGVIINIIIRNIEYFKS
jgi:hypothetical protein